MENPLLISYYFRNNYFTKIWNLIFSKTKFLFYIYILQFITGSSCLEENLNETKDI